MQQLQSHEPFASERGCGNITESREQRLADFAIGYILLVETAMPTRNISLTVEQNDFVQKVVDAGEYQNASEAVRDALRVLQLRRREDSLKLKHLRAQVNAGIAALERGEFAEFDDATLDEYVARLSPTVTKRLR